MAFRVAVPRVNGRLSEYTGKAAGFTV